MSFAVNSLLLTRRLGEQVKLVTDLLRYCRVHLLGWRQLHRRQPCLPAGLSAYQNNFLQLSAPKHKKWLMVSAFPVRDRRVGKRRDCKKTGLDLAVHAQLPSHLFNLRRRRLLIKRSAGMWSA